MTTDAGIVHVIDDDASWRMSVQRLLSAAGYRVLLHESAEKFLEGGDLEGPGCVLLDMRMPGLSGLELQQRIAERHHTLPIVFISGHGDIPTSVVAMRSGAEDFLTKPVETEVLLGAVERAILRDHEDRERRERLALLRSRISTLTPTERRVFDLVVRGRLNKHIAAELGTAERTVKWHRQHIMQKLELESLAEMVSLAERLGLISEQIPPASTSS